MNSPDTNIPDRREHHEVREVFVSACEVLAPIVESNAKVKTVSAFGMAQILIARFPTLTASQAHIVIATAEKLHYDKRLHAVLHKKN
jgi:hypothetical protein